MEYVHPDSSFKIRERIVQDQSEWKVKELSDNSMGKGLHKLFKAVVN